MSRKLSVLNSVCAGSALALATALVALDLAACTATPRYPIEPGGRAGGGVEPVRPRYPVDGAGAPRPSPARAQTHARDFDDDDDAPRTAPSGSISSRALPEGRGGRGSGVAGSALTTAPPLPGGGASRPPVLTRPSRTTVRSGETLFDIAERYRTPVRALIEANGLKPPYALAPGSVLILPPPLVYTVQESDTLFGIARRFNIDPRSLANLNDITLDTAMTRGRPLALPALARDQGTNPQASGPSPVGSTLGRAGGEAGLRGGLQARAPAPSVSASPSFVPQPRPARREPKTVEDARAAVAVAGKPAGAVPASGLPAAGALTDAQVAVVGRGRFIAPVKGQVLAGFGSSRPGQRNDGVNIAAPQGSTVKAAAAGEVVYAGSAIPGYGNLVLIKHPGGWVTAYAHLDSIGVKMRSSVAQGDKVGEVGQSGGVDQPQLHFEIRIPPEPDASAKPVDPALLLPGMR